MHRINTGASIIIALVFEKRIREMQAKLQSAAAKIRKGKPLFIIFILESIVMLR